MRKIKLRAWSGRLNEMYYGDDVAIVVEEDGSVSSYAFYNGERVDERIMQFTGLFDSKGAEIYENDIVKYTSRYRGDLMDCVVVFDSKQGQYKFCPFSMYKANAGDGGWTGFDYKMASRTEIIGNIYENPALLEE
jgi:uncharacterized phage protein (TIGR01671 family)